jgi:phosphoglycolate phosphatase
VVGDTTYDIEMARNAGVAAVGVAWGYHDEDVLLAAGAAKIIKSFAELPDLVVEMMGDAPCAL